MIPTKKALIVPLAALTACVVCAGAAAAQERGRGRSRDQQQSAPAQNDRATPRNQERTAPPEQGRPQQQDQRRQDQRQRDQRQQDQRPQAPRSVTPAPQGRPYQGPSVAPQRQAVPRVSPPYQGNRSYGSSRDYRDSRNYSYNSRSRSTYFAPHFFYSRPLYRPYYAFRPRINLGFGISIGYPVAYPTWYDPYLSSAYGWYRPGLSYGGISFDIQPYDAAIYIDGEYVGLVREFGPYNAPLTLPSGRHHVDLDAQGFEPLSFELTVLPRQVIPYHGTLPRYGPFGVVRSSATSVSSGRPPRVFPSPATPRRR